MNYKLFAMASVTLILIFISTAATTMPSIHMVSANNYEKSQSTTQINKCGNYWFPINVICSNIDSQITGDDNNVAVATPQESENIDSGPPFP
jgi:hypothetical protein